MGSSSKIIRIEDFDLTVVNPAAKYIELTSKMSLLAYRYNVSKADEIAAAAAQPAAAAPAAGTPAAPATAPQGVKK